MPHNTGPIRAGAVHITRSSGTSLARGGGRSTLAPHRGKSGLCEPVRSQSPL